MEKLPPKRSRQNIFRIENPRDQECSTVDRSAAETKLDWQTRRRPGCAAMPRSSFTLPPSNDDALLKVLQYLYTIINRLFCIKTSFLSYKSDLLSIKVQRTFKNASSSIRGKMKTERGILAHPRSARVWQPSFVSAAERSTCATLLVTWILNAKYIFVRPISGGRFSVSYPV